MGQTTNPDQRVRVDFAFWWQGRFVAIELTGSQTVTKARRAALLALDADDVEITEIDPTKLTRTEDLVAQLPDDFQNFWRDQPFPTGPFAPALTPP